MALATLSPDLICEILCRLSVKDLLRFRCVSKSWCSLIDDLDFIKLHLSHSVETSTNVSVFLINRLPIVKTFSANLDSLGLAQRLEIPGDESDEGRKFLVMGSCNGLLALFKCPNVPVPLFKTWLFKRRDEFYMWNPSTRKSQMLPVNEIGFTPQVFSVPHVRYGFGYDPISDDYKLVRIVQSFCLTVDFLESEVMVYSLKTNCWRRKKDFPFYLKYTRSLYAVLANNALHCEVFTRPKSGSENFDADYDLIAAFDLGTEEYRVIELPNRLGEKLETNINAMGGCLCLIATYREVGVDVVVDIWIMKEYGVKESWTKFISAKPFECFDASPYVLPLVFSKNGDKVLLHVGGMLFFYDLRSKKADKVEIEDAPNRYFEAEMMVESLVRLNGNDAMFNKKNQHSGKTKRKNTERDDISSKRIHQV